MTNTKGIDLSQRKVEKIGLLEKLGYTLGNCGGNMLNTMVTTYLLFYYTDVAGVNAAFVGGLFLVARIWDGINDPMMGMIADKTKTRWGSYRPYLLWMAIPMSVIGILCFTVPGNVGEIGKYVWCAVTYVLYGMIYTATYIPYGVMNNVMTQDTNQRATLSAFREVGSSLSSAVMGMVAMPIILYFGHGDSASQSGWTGVMSVFGVIIFVFVLCVFAFTKERIPASTEKLTLKQSFQALKGNKAIFIMSGALLISGTAIWFEFSWFMYFCKYVLGQESLMNAVITIYAAAGLVMQVVMPFMVRKFGKKYTMITGNVLFIISGVMFLLTRTSTMMCVTMTVFGLGLGLFYSCFWGSIPDAVEYGEWKSGVRAPGFIYSCGTLSNKLSTGLAGVLASVTLIAIQYVPNAEQTTETINAMRSVTGWYLLVASVVTIVLLFMYPITNKVYNQILAELAERKKNS